MKLLTIFAALTYVVNARETFSNDKPSRWCNYAYGYVGKPPSRSFIPMNNFTEEAIEREEWRDVVGREGKYQVSNLGRVRALDRTQECMHPSGKTIVRRYSGKIMRVSPTKYPRIMFENKGRTYLVHRLVAQAFLPNPLKKPCVNHIDGDTSNNNLSNLEWCTYSENELHSHRALGKISNVGNLKNYSEEWNDKVLFMGVPVCGALRKKIVELLSSGVVICRDFPDKKSAAYTFISRLRIAGVPIKDEFVTDADGKTTRYKVYFL